MRNTARQTRENRTITIDFQTEATYIRLLSDGKAFLECVLAFVMSLGFQLKHKATCGAVDASRATRIMSVSGWGASPSGGSSARHVERSSRSSRISSCATARCALRWPVMPS